MARPTDYSQELADTICELLANGVSLRTICLAEEMPAARSIFRWLRTYPEFCQQYARAKEESADALAEEILDIADEGSNDWMQANDEDNPGYRFNGEAVARSRLRVDSRKWIASKLKPKKYGDKVETTLTGPNGGPVDMNLTVGWVAPRTSSQA